MKRFSLSKQGSMNTFLIKTTNLGNEFIDHKKLYNCKGQSYYEFNYLELELELYLKHFYIIYRNVTHSKLEHHLV